MNTIRWILAALALSIAGAAAALERFDFESPYLVHPGLQVWDFCMVQDGGQVHAFYHTLPPDDLFPSNADTIWHAVSTDLREWSIVGPVLTSGPGWYDEVAMWAPDVVHDPATGRWAMLYTGVGANMVQRPCLAWSDDLEAWTKSANNPVFEPDTLTYHWGPDQAWSAFRDPFVFHDGGQWNMLSTAGLRLGGYPGYRRGIIHRAVSSDLETWSDAGVFFIHDGAVGATRDLESPQYLVRDGWHHLFFVEQDLTLEYHPTSHVVAADPADWTMTGRTYVAAGWAPEIENFRGTPGAETFAYLAKDQDPRDLTWFVTARMDSVRFEDGGMTPVVFAPDPLGPDWPVRTGDPGLAAPTFCDNPALRGDPGIRQRGHGWFGSGENYGGPLSGVGAPGLAFGDAATGSIESRPFVLEGGHFTLQLAGGVHPATCHVALVDDGTGQILGTIYPSGQSALIERTWDVRAHTGRTVRLRIVDEETGPDGWIAVDAIEEREGVVAVDGPAGDGPRRAPIASLGAYPNPFNGTTVLRFETSVADPCRVELYDLAGRRIWRSGELAAAGGEMQVVWDGRDAAGRNVPSGTYLMRVVQGTAAVAGVRVTLVK